MVIEVNEILGTFHMCPVTEGQALVSGCLTGLQLASLPAFFSLFSIQLEGGVGVIHHVPIP
jgi:hypothetical protein